MEISITPLFIVKNSPKSNHNSESNGKRENNNQSDDILDKSNTNKIINFSDYTNYLLNYPMQNIFWNGNIS